MEDVWTIPLSGIAKKTLGALDITIYLLSSVCVSVCVCACVHAHKAVRVLWSVAATCTLTMTAVANKGTKATAVTLLSAHSLRYCG